MRKLFRELIELINLIKKQAVLFLNEYRRTGGILKYTTQ